MSLRGSPISVVVEASGKSTTTAGAAPLMTVAGLHLAIKERLATIAERFRLQTKSSGGWSADLLRAPSVLDGWLPPKRKQQDGGEAADVENFPFVLVRPVSVIDSEQSATEQATATFEIIFGTYSDDDDGFLDALNLIDALRLDLGAKPRIQGTSFVHAGPLSARIEAARPQWFGIATTVWQLPRAQRIDPEA